MCNERRNVRVPANKNPTASDRARQVAQHGARHVLLSGAHRPDRYMCGAGQWVLAETWNLPL